MSPYVREMRGRVGTRLLLLPAVAALIRDGEGRILLQRRADDGRWNLPAGAIDPGESPDQAVVREVREETGLEVRPVRVAGVFGGPDGFRHRYPNGDEVEFTAIVFECAVAGGSLDSGDEETAELGWFHPQDRPPLSIEYPLEAMLSGGPAVFRFR
ncbi:MAG: NUDIX domain-containing protein [Longimicrobiaceae bacterium]